MTRSDGWYENGIERLIDLPISVLLPGPWVSLNNGTNGGMSLVLHRDPSFVTLLIYACNNTLPQKHSEWHRLALLALHTEAEFCIDISKWQISIFDWLSALP